MFAYKLFTDFVAIFKIPTKACKIAVSSNIIENCMYTLLFIGHETAMFYNKDRLGLSYVLILSPVIMTQVIEKLDQCQRDLF